MKALFFAKPIEYRLATIAEVLTQSETLAGEFTAVNRGAEPLKDRIFSVGLAYGEFKKIKENAAEAFRIVESVTLGDSVSLEPNETYTAAWRFILAPDCPITSKAGSLFLLYGSRLDEPGAFGMLDLRVNLSPVLESFIATVENHFSFEAGSRKTAGEFTEVDFKPPRAYPTLEKLQILMRLREGGMELVYQCKMKGFARGAGPGLKAKSLRIERTYPRDQVLIGNKHPNRNLFKSEFEATLAEIVPAFLQSDN